MLIKYTNKTKQNISKSHWLCTNLAYFYRQYSTKSKTIYILFGNVSCLILFFVQFESKNQSKLKLKVTPEIVHFRYKS